MAIIFSVKTPGVYSAIGLSTDTKPVNPPNDCAFFETDTSKTYHSVSGAWVAQLNASYALAGEGGGPHTHPQSDVVGLVTELAAVATALAAKASLSHTHAWADITGEPTTLAGYGITDGATDAELAAHEADTTSVHGIANTANLSLVGHAHAAADVTSGQFAMARLASGTPDGTKFVRDDGTLQSPGASSTNIKQTEVDFGTTPVSEASFVITDADVAPTSQLIGFVAYEAPTGKDLDELDMDTLDLKFAPGSGQATLYATCLTGYIAGNFKVNYLIG